MKTKIFLLLVALTLFACKKKQSTPEPEKPINPADLKYRIKEVIYPNEGKSSYEYNSNNQITKTINPDGSKTIYTYNTDGKLTKAESIENINPIYNSTTAYIYNNAGIKQEQISTRSDGTRNKIVYSINNNLASGYKYYIWNNVNATWIEDTNSVVTYTYNSNNQIIRFTNKSQYTILGYDDRGNASSRKTYVKKLNGSYYLYYKYDATFDTKKFINDYPEAAQNKVNNRLDAAYTYYLQNGAIDTQQSNTALYEYNAADYVSKYFSNGTLVATYILEEIK
jgi:YD repeat-containing protein